VLDRIGNQPSRNSDAPAAPALPSGDSLLPPTAGDDAPLVPKAD
jgi:preprotein translocase subunit SecG